MSYVKKVFTLFALLVMLVGLLPLHASARPLKWEDSDYTSDGLSPDKKAAAGSAGSSSGSLVYEVRSGDTLYKISRDFGVSVQDLMAWNSIGNSSLLKIGQKLNIPAQEAALTASAQKQGDPPAVKKVLITTLTAYTAGKESTGKGPSHPQYGITYSGKRAQEGRTIAVDPKVIPLGSKVYIEGIGIRTAEDIGSAIKGSRVDVFMNDLKQARKFGVKKNVKVYVL